MYSHACSQKLWNVRKPHVRLADSMGRMSLFCLVVSNQDSIYNVVPPGGRAGLGRGTDNPSGDIGEFHPLQEPHRGLQLEIKTKRMHEQLQREMQIRCHINQLAGIGISALDHLNQEYLSWPICQRAVDHKRWVRPKSSSPIARD